MHRTALTLDEKLSVVAEYPWHIYLCSEPFKFGVVGSTDSHTGLSTAQEDNFFGKVTLVEPCGWRNVNYRLITDT
jgi:hypothetical protein